MIKKQQHTDSHNLTSAYKNDGASLIEIQWCEKSSKNMHSESEPTTVFVLIMTFGCTCLIKAK